MIVSFLSFDKGCIIPNSDNRNQALLPLKPTFWLHFHIDGNGTEWIDEQLPTPNYLYHANKGCFIGWQVEGFFATQKGIEYLNDIIGRVTISLNETRPKRLPYKPDTKETLAHYYPKIHRLLDFQNAKSLSKKTHAPVRADSLGGKDYCFWAIKLYTEDLIRQFNEGTPVPYHMIEDWAFSQFSDHKKGLSTVRAKCRSVWNWNNDQDWTLPKAYKRKYTDKENEMSRTEHMKKVNENRKIATRNKIKAVLDDMFMQDQIKMKNGKYKISAIAKLAGVHRETVSEHLKKMNLI